MSDTPTAPDDLGGDDYAGEHPGEPDIPEQPHPDVEDEDEDS